MAVAPTFVVSKAVLVSALRLTGAGGADQVALIDSAINSARLKLYKHLGRVRVAALAALALVENPTTNDGLLRLQAQETETKIVRRLLVETMPTLFMDASGNSLEVFNSEAAFRQGRPTRAALDGWDAEILKDLDILKGDVEFGDAVGRMRTDLIVPDTGNEAPSPGDTIWGGTDQGIVDRTTYPLDGDGA